MPKHQGWEFAHLLNAHLLICSFCSNQMSDCERFAQITEDKWAAVSELLRSLRGNERPWAIFSGRSEEMSYSEQITQVAHQKWANEWIVGFLSESLIRSFLGKKRAISSENQCGIYKTIDPYPDPSAALGDGNLINCSKKNLYRKIHFSVS